MDCINLEAPPPAPAVQLRGSEIPRFLEPASENERGSQHTARQKATECLDAWFDDELHRHQEMLLSSLRTCLSRRLEEHRGIFTAKLQEETALLQRVVSKEQPEAKGASGTLSCMAVDAVKPPESHVKTEQVAIATPEARKVDADSAADGLEIFDSKHLDGPDTDPAKDSTNVPTHLPKWLSQVWQQCHQALVPDGHTAEFGPRCHFIKGIVRHVYFEVFSTSFILLSSALVAAEVQYVGTQVGYDLEHHEYTNLPDPMWEVFFTVATILTNTMFFCELSLRISAAQQGAFCAPWLWLDTILVALSLVDLFNTLGMAISGSLRVSAVRMVRLFRIVRLVKVVRKQAALHSLFLLLKSIRAAMSASVWSFVLLLLIMFVSGLIMSQLTQPAMKDDSIPIDVRLQLFDHFGTFSKTMVTMFEITTANWVPVCRLIMSHVGETFAYFIVAYRCVFCFAVINVIRAVFMAETFRVASADDDVAMIKRDRAAAFMLEKMKAVFQALDLTGDGLVSWSEFSSMLHDEDVKNFMSILDLDVHDCCNVFRILDTDASGGVSCEEFIEGVKHIRGFAKRIDVATLMTVTRKIEKKIDTALANDTADIERLIQNALTDIETKIEESRH